MTEKQQTYDLGQDVGPLYTGRTSQQQNFRSAPVVQSHGESWQGVGVSKPFEIRLPQEFNVSEKPMPDALTYDTLQAIKADLKALFASYAANLDINEKIKLSCIRNSLISTLVNDFLELNQAQAQAAAAQKK